MIQHRNPTIGMDQLLDPEFEGFGLPSSSLHAPGVDGRPTVETQDEDGELHISAQQRLWLAVVQMAVKDATLPDSPDDADPELTDTQRRQARAVIFSRSSVTAGYFNEVCNLAGVDPEVIRLNVSKMIREGVTINDE